MSYIPLAKRRLLYEVVEMRRLGILSSITICSLLLFSQVLYTVASTGWTKIYAGDAYDCWIPSSIIQTNDGGYFMAVFVDSKHIDDIGFPGHLSSSQYELHLIKTDSAGTVQFEKVFTQSNDSNSELYSLIPGERYSIVQTVDGEYAIAGSTANNEFWLFKVNSQGNMFWSKKYLPSSETDSRTGDTFYSMIETREGGFALIGSTETAEGGRDFLFIKVDAQGNEQWNQKYNSGTYSSPSGEFPREDQARSIFQTNDGGYVIAGQTTTVTSLSSTYETWLVKTDSSGEEQWTKKYSGPNAPGLEYKVVQTKDGGFAFAGTEQISDENTDFFLIRTDALGEVQWRKTYGNEYDDWACSLLQLNDGGFAVAGTMTEVVDSEPISRDFGLLRVDPSGNTLWTEMYNAKENSTLNTKSSETVYSMVLTSDGSYAIVGSTVNAWDGSHVDVFFVKTESLEDPLKPSNLPLVVSNVIGNVQVQLTGQQNNLWLPAINGDSLTQGSKIGTEENGGQLKLGDGMILKIEPGTLIEVKSLADNSNILLLSKGEFTADVDLPPSNSLAIEMSQAIAEIKGTIFTVTETGAESTLSVREGQVFFTSKVDGKNVNVLAGQKITASNLGLGPTEAESEGLGIWIYIAALIVTVILVAIILIVYMKRRNLKQTPEKPKSMNRHNAQR